MNENGPVPANVGAGPFRERWRFGRLVGGSLAAGLIAMMAALPMACAQQPTPAPSPSPTVAASPVASESSEPMPVNAIEYQIAASYPHDPEAFTEGLVWHDGELIESTGLEGKSDIRRVRLADGSVIKRASIPDDLFGEGVVVWKKQLLSVTWKSGRGFRWSLPSLKLLPKRGFTYPGEGWGMTSSDTDIILSDGTATLRFLDPKSFAERRRLEVTANGNPLSQLNEVEWVDGKIYANVWQSQWIVRIDPITGIVDGAIDIGPLAVQADGDLQNRTPNGIAWDPDSRRLLVTGKNWDTLFALTLTPATP